MKTLSDLSWAMTCARDFDLPRSNGKPSPRRHEGNRLRRSAMDKALAHSREMQKMRAGWGYAATPRLVKIQTELGFKPGERPIGVIR